MLKILNHMNPWFAQYTYYFMYVYGLSPQIIFCMQLPFSYWRLTKLVMSGWNRYMYLKGYISSSVVKNIFSAASSTYPFFIKREFCKNDLNVVGTGWQIVTTVNKCIEVYFFRLHNLVLHLYYILRMAFLANM